MHSEDSDQTGQPPVESSLGSYANSLVLSRRGSNMAELFLEMTQWKNLMSGRVQVLDFAKSLVYSNCQNDRNVFFVVVVVVCFFVYVPGKREEMHCHQLNPSSSALRTQSRYRTRRSVDFIICRTALKFPVI